ncbi:hypothetical protein BT63DRAFT_459537 [Microthyrium microscopicum]|uniref:Uncharacterized protein n=1 Tax=Microthyrium microscopicum TaxID=703497 RepID=A0A6A6TXV7_9PEZI|nr:hypothetical protein BT63DRAFT_459537 [Microthyrium microscopicum]
MAPELLIDARYKTVTETISASIQSKPPLTLVEDPSFVPTDFPILQFQRGASEQVNTLLTEHGVPFRPSPLLITSPYNLPNHHLDLNRLDDVQDRVLTLALTYLAPIRDDYATAAYEESLNWDHIRLRIKQLSRVAEQAWTSRVYYVVIFRSKLKADHDRQLLWDLDRESHREAVQSGGLLKYWFGQHDDEVRNLATCVWRNREDARAGGTGPWHQKARAAGRKLYDRIEFSIWRMTITDDADSISFGPWSD